MQDARSGPSARTQNAANAELVGPGAAARPLQQQEGARFPRERKGQHRDTPLVRLLGPRRHGARSRRLRPALRALAARRPLHPAQQARRRREAVVAARLARARVASSRSTARRASRPRSCAAASTSSTSRGSTGSTCEPLVVVSEGKIGYVYARDGQPLPPTQTLGRTIDCNHFQDAAAFLREGGQRGRQRAFLREGVYALNLAAFVVVTEDGVLAGPIRDSDRARFADWHQQLLSVDGFSPGRRRPRRAARAPGKSDRRATTRTAWSRCSSASRSRPSARATRSASSRSTTARRSSPPRSSPPR